MPIYYIFCHFFELIVSRDLLIIDLFDELNLTQLYDF